MAVLAQPTGNAEAESLAAIRHPERRVEPGRDQAATAAGASLAECGHRRQLNLVARDDRAIDHVPRMLARHMPPCHDPTVPLARRYPGYGGYALRPPQSPTGRAERSAPPPNASRASNSRARAA